MLIKTVSCDLLKNPANEKALAKAKELKQFLEDTLSYDKRLKSLSSPSRYLVADVLKVPPTASLGEWERAQIVMVVRGSHV